MHLIGSNPLNIIQKESKILILTHLAKKRRDDKHKSDSTDVENSDETILEDSVYDEVDQENRNIPKLDKLQKKGTKKHKKKQNTITPTAAPVTFSTVPITGTTPTNPVTNPVSTTTTGNSIYFNKSAKFNNLILISSHYCPSDRYL